MTTISVIIPTFNREKKVARAIASVLYQTYGDYEVVLVDDGSTDGTRHTIAQFGNRIERLFHPFNLGVSAARNTGIRGSRGPFIALLDSDDYWLPQKLEAQMEFFENHPEAHICQTQEIWIRKGHRVNPKEKHMKPSGDIFAASLKRCLISPSAVMFRRALVEDVGLFDETLPACEDYDLWLRMTSRHAVHLLSRYLVVKEGGHPDQLSFRHWGMDRFRIRAIVKLIKAGSLSELQLEAALKELSLKCRIYGRGCIKRRKWEEGAFYLRLPEKLRKNFPPSLTPFEGSALGPSLQGPL